MECRNLLNTEFNDFLFAPIGEEKNAMLLSVISALARLDIDPWQEAARLTQLPKGLATQRLTFMVEGLPGGQWASSDSRVIAARLVQLLPSRNNSKVASNSKASLVAANQGSHQIDPVPDGDMVDFCRHVRSSADDCSERRAATRYKSH